MPETIFPANEREALAMLYVKLQATAGHSPKELLRLYQAAYDAIFEEQELQFNEGFEEL